MRVVDLFAGAGGLSAGAALAGIDVVAAADSWPIALENYNHNFSHNAELVDLADTAVATESVRQFHPDVIVGGPPCQDFSDAGKREEGYRANLTIVFSEIVTECLPDAFIMENVPSASNSRAYEAARALFNEAGYSVVEMVLDAAYYEVPQRRRRLVVIGTRGVSSAPLTEALELRQSIFPLSVRQGVPSIKMGHYYRHPRSYSRRAVFSIDEPSPTVRGVNRPRPPEYKPHPGDSASTIENPSIRALTASERALIQTFKPNYSWSGTRTDIEQMVGNAVPHSSQRRSLKSWRVSLKATVLISSRSDTG